MEDLKTIDKKISVLRLKMERLIERENELCSEKVVNLSRELDGLIFKFLDEKKR